MSYTSFLRTATTITADKNNTTNNNSVLYSPADSRSGNVNPLRVVCGGLAAATAKTIIAPLNRLTIILQSQGMPSLRHHHNQTPVYTTIMGSFRNMIEKEGVKSLWNGNGTNVFRVIPNYGLRFALNDMSREWIAKMYGLDPNHTRHSLTNVQLLLSSAIAAVIQITCTYPIEVVSTRLAVSGSALSPIHYNGLVHCITDLVQKEGFRGLYNGFPITLLAGTPYVTIQMSMFELLQRLFHEVLEVGANSGSSGGKSDRSVTSGGNDDNQIPTNPTEIGVLPKILAGASASLIAQTVTYPGDILRRRMQLDGMGTKREYAYNHIWDATKKIYKHEGWRAFFKGIHVNSLRILPEGALVFVLVDGFKKLLDIERFDTH
jgi:hypothetical protein